MTGEKVNSSVPAPMAGRLVKNSPSSSADAAPCRAKTASSYRPNHWKVAGCHAANSLKRIDKIGMASLNATFTPAAYG